MEGINGISPVINKIIFEQKGKVSIHLRDGRIIITPLKYFPSIEKLNQKQRKKYFIADDQIIMFDDCNEVFHLEQFLGKEEEYRYHFT